MLSTQTHEAIEIRLDAVPSVCILLMPKVKHSAYFFAAVEQQGFPFLRVSRTNQWFPPFQFVRKIVTTQPVSRCKQFCCFSFDIYTADYIFHWRMLLFVCFRTFFRYRIIEPCVRMTTRFNMRVLHAPFHDEHVTIPDVLSKCTQIWVEKSRIKHSQME